MTPKLKKRTTHLKNTRGQIIPINLNGWLTQGSVTWNNIRSYSEQVSCQHSVLRPALYISWGVIWGITKGTPSCRSRHVTGIPTILTSFGAVVGGSGRGNCRIRTEENRADRVKCLERSGQSRRWLKTPKGGGRTVLYWRTWAATLCFSHVVRFPQQLNLLILF